MLTNIVNFLPCLFFLNTSTKMSWLHPSLPPREVCGNIKNSVLQGTESALSPIPTDVVLYRLFTVWIHWATQMRGVISDRAGRCKSGSICENCVDHRAPNWEQQKHEAFFSSFDEWNVLFFFLFLLEETRDPQCLECTEFPLDDLSLASPLVRPISSVTGAPAAPWGGGFLLHLQSGVSMLDYCFCTSCYY